MTWEPFHHPDLSLPVVRRQASELLLEMAYGLGQTVFHLRWGDPLIDSEFRNRLSYNNAVYRLRKSGLIAYRRRGGKSPIMSLTPAARKQMPPVFRPAKYWDRKWSGSWYVLVYDVPEAERSYRTALRRFLKRRRMGCLQGSVWVSPRDIRPEFSDLQKAAAVGDYAFLFESRTVLGQPAEEVVRAAWPVDRLEELQTRFITVYTRNLQQLKTGPSTEASLMALARQELRAYRTVMDTDPLLPRKLWPTGYRGSEVYRLHQQLVAELKQRIACSET